MKSPKKRTESKTTETQINKNQKQKQISKANFKMNKTSIKVLQTLAAFGGMAIPLGGVAYSANKAGRGPVKSVLEEQQQPVPHMKLVVENYRGVNDKKIIQQHELLKNKLLKINTYVCKLKCKLKIQ